MNKALLACFLMIVYITKTVAMGPAELDLSALAPEIRKEIYNLVVERIANDYIGRDMNLNPAEFYNALRKNFGAMCTDIMKTIRNQSIVVWNKNDSAANVNLGFHENRKLSEKDTIPAKNIRFVRLPSNLCGQNSLITNIFVNVWGRSLRDASPTIYCEGVELKAGSIVAVNYASIEIL